MPGSLRIEKWPACKVYFSCVTTESSYYWKIKKKNSKNENTVSKEDRILSWCWEEMEKRGRNFWPNWELRACQPQQTTSMQRFHHKKQQATTSSLAVSKVMMTQLWTGIWKRKDIPVLSFIRDRQFSSLKQVFVGKAKQLHCTCKSRRLQKAFKQSQEGNFFHVYY